MVLPSWLSSRLRPIALEDTLKALTAALALPLAESAWYDIPGPEVLTGKEILERVAALQGRRLPSLSLPWLSPRLSALWLRFVTRANYALARELVLGLSEDLLPDNEAYWELTGLWPTISFEAAARTALEAERRARPGPKLGALEEALVRRLAPPLRGV